MATAAHRHDQPSHRANVGPLERWASILGGVGMASVAVALIGRGATRYSPVKARLTEGTSLRQGFAEQWRRATTAFRGETATIGSMADMYVSELQELHDCDRQIELLLPQLGAASDSTELKRRIEDYSRLIAAQRQQVAKTLEALEADVGVHRDEAMKTMFSEAIKMTGVEGSPALRDAGLIASLQRIIHYRIATLGTVAAYAKNLGHEDETRLLATFADKEKSLDEALTELAKSAINPGATSG